MSNKQRVIPVIGMHRSGTSVVTRGLMALGVSLGDGPMAEAYDNPKGFWEDMDIVNLNDRLLSKLGMNWYSVRLIEPSQWEKEEVISLKLEAIDLVRSRFGKYPIWSFKDPRTARLLPFWRSVFDYLGIEDSYIIVMRSPISVAESLKVRNGIRPEISHLLWLEHYISAINDICNRPYVVADYDQIMTDPSYQFQRVANRLNIPLNESTSESLKEYIRDFVAPELRHTIFPPDEVDLDNNIPELVRRLYKILFQSANDNLSLNEVREEFNLIENNLKSIKPVLQCLDDISSEEEINRLRKEIELRGHDIAFLKEELKTKEKEIELRGHDIAFLKEELRTKEKELTAVYSSKTWRIGQLYGRTIGISSPIRTKFIPAFKRLFKKGNNDSLKTEYISDEILAPNGTRMSYNHGLGEGVSEREDAVRPPGTLIGNKHDIFFFPMIDFSFRYQRPQHLASYHAKNGHRVFYMNITQFLPPDSKEDFRINKIKENIYEVFLKCPIKLNVYSGKIESDVLEILYDSLNSLRKRWGLITTLSLVHNPFWTPLVLRMKDRHGWKIVYDCLDEWDTFSGIGKDVLEQEVKLVKSADLLLVTAELLYKKWSKFNPTCTIVRNACDYDHFTKALPTHLLEDIKKPIIGFFGGIADWIDIDIIHYAATQRKDWSFVLLGGIFTDVSSIKKLSNVHLLGNQPYSDMPAYLHSFDVCLIPFKKNKITEAVDPVKLYEYFSSGKPVVSRDLYEIRQYKDYLYLFNTPEEFIECIKMALNEQDSEVKEKRRAIAASNTWDERVSLIGSRIKDFYGMASIIVVTYNNIEYTRLCIESIISKTDYPNYEIIIVDNNSTDGTCDYLMNIQKKFNFVKVILNKKNEGFAKANNQGIQLASGDYIVFLNNDTVVTKGWLTKLIYYLDKYPEIGLIGPVTNFCGNEAKIDVPYKGLNEMDNFAYYYTSSREGLFFDIKMLALYCAATRREIIEEVGMLDDRFSVGMFEDDDFSHRIKLKGYRVVCAEDIFVHHFGQAAFKKLLETGKYHEIFERNRKLFEEKWKIRWETHKHRTKAFLPQNDTDIKRTKEHWGKEAGTWQVGRGMYWLEHEEVQRRINKKVSGDPSINPYKYLVEFMSKNGFVLPVDKCLTLGCGAGDLEIELSQYNFCLSHDAFDISDEAIKKAKSIAMKKKLTHINYKVEDINKIRLTPNTYDVIFGVGAVHHFSNLEHIFNEVNKALKPNGIFFLNEYIGPSRFQWSERQLDIINSILRILPKKYKRVITDPSVYKEIYNRPTIQEVIKVDPSEAVRSEEIVPLLNKYFDILELKQTGGAILHSLLTNIAWNFETDNHDDMKWLKAIFDIEDLLMKHGDVSSDFAVIIATKRKDTTK